MRFLAGVASLCFVFTPGVVLAQEAEAAPVDDGIEYGTCLYEGKSYSVDSRICMSGLLFKCEAALSKAPLWTRVLDADVKPIPCGHKEGVCFFADKRYSEGALLCMNQKSHRCTAASKWEFLDGESCT